MTLSGCFPDCRSSATISRMKSAGAGGVVGSDSDIQVLHKSLTAAPGEVENRRRRTKEDCGLRSRVSTACSPQCILGDATRVRPAFAGNVAERRFLALRANRNQNIHVPALTPVRDECSLETDCPCQLAGLPNCQKSLPAPHSPIPAIFLTTLPTETPGRRHTAQTLNSPVSPDGTRVPPGLISSSA